VGNHSRFASTDAQRLLAENGIGDLESAFRAGQTVDAEHERLATRHATRVIVRMDLKSDVGPTTVYIKRQWQRDRWLPRPTDIRHRINLQCSPIHEWRGLRLLQAAGFHVSEPLAIFWRGLGLSRGAVVTRAVPPTRSMADMQLGGDFERMDHRKRDSLIEAAANVVVRLQRARIAWRSMKAKHFYPEDLGGNRWRIWLIDCEGVYRWASRRDCEREWRTYLGWFKSRSPALTAAFVSAYSAAQAA
jgi:hypothetical protein